MRFLSPQILRKCDFQRIMLFTFLSVLAGLIEFIFLTSVPYIFEILQTNNIYDFCGNGIRDTFLCLLDLDFRASVLAVAILALLSGIMKLVLLWMTVSFSFEITRAWSERIFCDLEAAHYESIALIDKSSFVSAVTQKLQACSTFIYIPIFNLINNFFLGLVILISMFWINFTATTVAFGLLVIFYGGLLIFVNPVLKREGVKFSQSIENKTEYAATIINNIKSLQFWGGIRSRLPNLSQADIEIKNSQIKSQFLGLSPRALLEGVGLFVFLAWLSFTAISVPGAGSDSGNLLAQLLGLGLAAQRVLPSIQVVFNAASALRFGRAAFNDVTEYLTPNFESLSDKKEIDFQSTLELKDVVYNYGDGNFSLSVKHLLIHKGEKVLVHGGSGSGKTTLIDLFMGLRVPGSGVLLVDDKELIATNLRGWFQNIAYVSQSPYIFKGNFYKNVTLRDDVVAQDIKLDSRFNKLIDGLDLRELFDSSYELLEGGANLSGGQKQRIALARALYSDRPLVILDEFTSALDEQSSLRAQALIDVDTCKTFLIISHNPLVGIKMTGEILVEENKALMLTRRG